MSNVTLKDLFGEGGLTQRGWFLDNSFHNEFFSLGRRHMAAATIGGIPQFIHGETTLHRTTEFFELIEKEQLENGGRHWWGGKNTTSCWIGNIKFIKYYDDSLFSKEFRMKYTQRKGDPMFSSIGKTDMSFICWFAQHYDFDSNEHPLMKQMMRRVAEICELEMLNLIGLFHKFLTREHDPRRHYSLEVYARQNAMAFYSLLSIRNLYLVEGDYTKLRNNKFEHGLAAPVNLFEDLCNLLNKTDYDVAHQIYNPEFTKRESEANSEIVRQIIRGGGHAGIVNNILSR